MATTYSNSQIGYCDANNNVTVIYPYTKAENVEWSNGQIAMSVAEMLNNLFTDNQNLATFFDSSKVITYDTMSAWVNNIFITLPKGKFILIGHAAIVGHLNQVVTIRFANKPTARQSFTAPDSRNTYSATITTVDSFLNSSNIIYLQSWSPTDEGLYPSPEHCFIEAIRLK